MASFTNISSLEWANRQPNEFITAMLLDSSIHSSYSIYDGVKDKMQIPIFSGNLAWSNDFCTFNPQSDVDVTEKEFTTKNYKWAFKNCKTALQRTFRSALLRKGANNQETLDAQLKDWVFMYFAKLASKKVSEEASSTILTQLKADANVIKATSADLANSKDETKVLTVLGTIFKAIPKELYVAHFHPNGTVIDKDNPLRMQLPYEMFRAAHLALASDDKGGVDHRANIEAGRVPKEFLGVQIVLDVNLPETEVVVGKPSNFVTVVDDMGDVTAIQTKWMPELSSDYIWGQFTIGFGYKVSKEIVLYTLS